MSDGTTTSLAEVVELAAVDSELFEKYFFPETSRMDSALFHPEMNSILDSQERYCNFQIFRGGAKTSKFRLYMAKRVAYAVSRTIVLVGKSQDHAIRSVVWLRKQIEQNKLYSSTFRLERGSKWTDTEINIRNRAAGIDIWVVAFGITGSVRGVNFDDYRPDLILVDDVVDDENSATEEQRQKTEKLILGALKESLTPPTEAPFAKLVILQTPQDHDDFSQKALRDPQFKSVRYGCWTKETEDLPLDQRLSSWPARYPTEYLRKEKLAAAARNSLSTFSREMECKLVTPETSNFREEWIQFYGEAEKEPEPDWSELWIEMVIDPIPPPSEEKIRKGLHNKDFEAFAVVGRKGGKYYLMETVYNRGHEPSWTVAEFFRLANKWRPKKVMVESTAYQRTLSWLLKQAMKQAGRYWLIEEYDDKRRKHDRILDGITGPASNRQLFIHRDRHSEFLNQFIHYPNIRNDDVIETVAIALTSLSRGGLPGGAEEYDYKVMEADIPALENYRGAP